MENQKMTVVGVVCAVVVILAGFFIYRQVTAASALPETPKINAPAGDGTPGTDAGPTPGTAKGPGGGGVTLPPGKGRR